MARRLFVVEDTFAIRTRGLVLVPGLVPVGAERFRSGDPIELRRPDGSALAATIGGLEMLSPDPSRGLTLLISGMAKDDVPIGTEVWSVDR